MRTYCDVIEKKRANRLTDAEIQLAAREFRESVEPLRDGDDNGGSYASVR